MTKNIRGVLAQLWILTVLGGLIIQVSPAFGQTGNEVNVNIVVQAPYSPYYYDYRDKLLITVQNKTNQIQHVKVVGQIVGDNDVIVSTHESYFPPQPLTLNPLEIRTIFGSQQSQGFFDQKNLLITAPDDVKNLIIATGLLPEGNYQICLQARDYQSSVPLSQEAPLGCAFIPITYLNPPILINPLCEGEIIAQHGVFPTFNWTPPTGSQVGAQIRYDLFIVKLFPGQNPNDAVAAAVEAGSGEFIAKRGLMTPFYTLLPTDLPLEIGAQYGWQVIARDLTELVPIENGGRSEVCQFYVRTNTEERKSPEVGAPTAVIKTDFPLISSIKGRLLYKFPSAATYVDLSANEFVTQTMDVSEIPISYDVISGPVRVHKAPLVIPYLNKADLSSGGAKPLANKVVRLVVYELHHDLDDHAFLRNQALQTLETTKTDAHGNFSFSYLSMDTLYGKTVSFYSGDVLGQYLVTKVLRIVVEDHHFCSPATNIVLNPGTALDMGDLTVYTNSYRGVYCIYKALDPRYQQKLSNQQAVPNISVAIYKSGIYGPYEEGNTTQVKQDGFLKKVFSGTSNAKGEITIDYLTKHIYDNAADRYFISATTQEFNSQSAYIYKDQLKTTPVLKYHHQGKVGIKVPYGPFFGPIPVFNNEYKYETFRDTVQLIPERPKVWGDVMGKSWDLAATDFSAGASDVVGIGNYSDHQMQAFFPGANFSTSGTNSVLEGASVSLLQAGVNKSYPSLTILTGGQGKYSFDNLPLEEKENPGEQGAFSVIGPRRTLIASKSGYKTWLQDLGILAWGALEYRQINLEPKGRVYGWVENEQGEPIKAKIYINEEAHTTTMFNSSLQSSAGIPLPAKQIFGLAAPAGNVQVHIVPEDLVYAENTVHRYVPESNEPVSLGAFVVKKMRHRIQLQVYQEVVDIDMNKPDPISKYQKPVKNALVRINNILGAPIQNSYKSTESVQVLRATDFSQTGQTWGYTDEQGILTLIFDNNDDYFSLDILPPQDLKLAKASIDVTNKPSIDIKALPVVILKYGNWLSGKVTDTNGSPVANARISFANTSETIETFSDPSGNYVLKGLPDALAQCAFTASNTDPNRNLLGKTRSFPVLPDTANFVLADLPFNCPDIWGFKVSFTNITPSQDEFVCDGYLHDLVGNPNFSPTDPNLKLPFSQILLKEDGEKMVPVNTNFEIDVSGVQLRHFKEFVVKVEPDPGSSKLKIVGKDDKTGSLVGKPKLLVSSFTFHEAYAQLKDIKPESSHKSQPATDQVMPLSPETGFQQADATLFAGMIYQILGAEAQISLQDEQGKWSVKTLSSTNYPIQKFRVANPLGADGNFTFKLQAFNAVAVSATSYTYSDTLSLSSSLKVGPIENCVPPILDVSMGDIKFYRDGYQELSGDKPIQFDLEKWTVVADDWSFKMNDNGLQAKQGTLKTGLFTTKIKDIEILPQSLDISKFDQNSIALGDDVLDLDIKADVVTFAYRESCPTDQKSHWEFSILGVEGKHAAEIQPLPGMASTDRILIEKASLYSNGDQVITVGSSKSTVRIYDIVDFKPKTISLAEGGVDIHGFLDAGIPLLEEGNGGFRYRKEGGKVVDEFLGSSFKFIGPGKVEFTPPNVGGVQKIEPGLLEVTGSITDPEGIVLQGLLRKTKQQTILKVDPLGQSLKIGENSKLVDVTGDLKVNTAKKAWDHFTFSGDLNGFKGIAGKTRKTFTVYGAIRAENEGLDVSKIAASFPGIDITYDFKHNRLVGELEFKQSFASLSLEGHVNLLMDSDGWYFAANGKLKTPALGDFGAGLAIGDYNIINPKENKNQVLLNNLSNNCYKKQIPSTFKAGFSGFMFSGARSIPGFSIPETSFTFPGGKAYLKGSTGINAMVYMNFTDAANLYGIGVIGHADVKLGLETLACASISGSLSAMLGLIGAYNSSSGVFNLDGCGGITVKGSVSLEFPYPCLKLLCCKGLKNISISESLKAEMTISSANPAPKFDLGFGECFNSQLSSKW